MAIAGVEPPAGSPTAVPWHGLDGNRLVVGRGPLRWADPVDVDIGTRIEWLVGARLGSDPAWVAVDESGSISLVVVEATGRIAVTALGSGYTGIAPVLLGGAETVLPAPAPGSWSLPVGDGGHVVAVLDHGRIAIDDRDPIDVGALPDARVVFDGEGSALILAGATDRYRHGVLGDVIEASRVVRIDLEAGEVETVVDVGGNDVIEGTAPIWVDIDSDGSREIVVTVSNAAGGARLVAYRGDGTIAAESDPIGRPGRWRHQIVVGPLGPESEIEIVDVLTPHLGGVVEFFRIRAGRLDRVASIGGYTSHVIGSRNLSQAVAADADGDGHLEVVLVTQDRSAIAGIVRTDAGAQQAWSVPIGGRLSSNLSFTVLEDGSLALAAGRPDGVLRVWLP